MSLEAIRYSEGRLEILDQLLLPQESVYIPVHGTEDGWRVIRSMQVRGAPAIGVVGCLSLAVELHKKTFPSCPELVTYATERLDFLVTARPTAVNMADSREKLVKMMTQWSSEGKMSADEIRNRLLAVIEQMQEEDIAANRAMAGFGADHILANCDPASIKILTHCNTGSLATAGYGTALGVVRNLFERGKLDHCFCTETRPYNQGSRLTAYELVFDKIPSTLICDDMAAALMKQKGISAVVVGADRIVANGDTANKIGTYQLAVLARYHGIPFYTVAPSTSIDLTLESGEQIVIEERPHDEMTSVKGMRVAAPGINCWNPAFDVAPAELITGGIVTEFGVYKPSELREKLTQALHNAQG